jgi:hypothetical protein
LWSPKRNKNQAKNVFYDNMTRVRAGDVVFSFCDSLIKAVGVARSGAESAPKPAEFGERGSYWGNEGWLVPVDFVGIDSPIRPKDHIEVLRPTLPAKYSPLRANGDGLQSVYLAEVPVPMAGVLRGLLKGQVETVVEGYRSRLDPQAEDDAAEQALRADPNITATEKEQLIKARRGQGLYRSRLDTIETTCRITGLSQRGHLRASHIKPWRLSTNSEKLDGNNGLLLSPHIDHLFDRGFISFADDGGMLVSSKLDPQVFARWNIDPAKNVGQFSAAQRQYLAFHRDNILAP